MLATNAPSRLLHRNIQLGLLTLLLLASLAFVLSLMLTPDPARNLYYKAQGLEANGLWEQALKHYELVVKKNEFTIRPARAATTGRYSGRPGTPVGRPGATAAGHSDLLSFSR